MQLGLDLPAVSLEALRPYVQMTDAERSFRSFLDKFNVLRRFYQSPEIIERLAYEVVEDAARENVRYLELRFTPAALGSANRYAFEDVIAWVQAGVARARADHPRLQVGLIISLNRHEPVKVAERVTRLAVDLKDQGIVGLDLAGDEVNFPAEPFEHLFQAAGSAGLGLTAHAGEWTGAAAVRHAIERLGVQRVGHGVRVVEDPAAAALARERGTVFEVCLTSNLHSGVIGRMAEHPLPAMRAMGLRTTLNTDDPAVSDITLSTEYALAVEALGLGLAEVRQAILTAAGAAFLPPGERAALVAQFERELALSGVKDLATNYTNLAKGAGE